MDKLKLILKKALEKGASHVTLQLGSDVKFMFEHARPISVPELGAVDLEWIESLYKALFPREGLALRSEQLVRSQFNIVNVGKVFAIADPRSPKTLHLFFPPKGELLSQDFWIQLSAGSKSYETSTSPTQPTPTPPIPSQTQVINVPVGSAAATGDATVVVAAAGATSSTARPEPTTIHVTDTGFQKALAPIPVEVLMNKHRLVVLISSDAQIQAKVKEMADSLDLFLYTTTDESLYQTILDTLSPQFFYLDEAIASFESFLKRMYNLVIEKRALITVLLLSKTAQFTDTKLAFAMSVDGIINRGHLDLLKEQSLKRQDDRKEIFQTWLDLSKKV